MKQVERMLKRKLRINTSLITIVLLAIILASCGSSSNFQRKKYLNLKPLNSSSETTDTNQDLEIHPESSDQPQAPISYPSEQQFSDLPIEISKQSGLILSESAEPLRIDLVKKTRAKLLLEPKDAEAEAHEKKAVVFGALAFLFLALMTVALILTVVDYFSLIGGITAMGVLAIPVILFGILAIVNASQTLTGKKEQNDWAVRLTALGMGIGSLIGIFVDFILLLFLTW